MRGEIIDFFIIKQIKKPRLVLWSVVKHLGSGRALKKWGKTLDCVSCFPLHLFRALTLPARFTAEHSTVEASLFVNYTLTQNVHESHKSLKGITDKAKLKKCVYTIETDPGLGGGGGDASCNGLYGEAPPERGTFFSL